MKKTAILTALAAITILASCADVPENIRKEKEELDAKSEYIRETEAVSGDASVTESTIEVEGEEVVLEKASLAEIRARLDDESSKRFGNMTFAHVSAGTADTMPSFRVRIQAKEDYDLKALVSGMLGEDRFDYNNASLFDHVPPEGEPTEITTDPDTSKQMLIAPSQLSIDACSPDINNDPSIITVMFSDGHGWGNIYGQKTEPELFIWTTQKPEACYYPEYEEISGISYTMRDGSEWALSDAVRLCEEKYNSVLSEADAVRLEYKVWRAYVFPTDEGHKCYFFVIKPYDENGWGIDSDSYEKVMLEERYAENGKRFFLANDNYAITMDKDDLSHFTKGFSYVPGETVDEGTDLLTFASAASVVQNKMGKNYDGRFETAELCYIFTSDKYPGKDYDLPVDYNQLFAETSCEITARPYWVFRKDYNLFRNWNSGINLYVDALTGEVHTIM